MGHRFGNITGKIIDALLRCSPQYWIMKAVLGGYNPPGYLGEDPPTPFGVIEQYLYREGVGRSARHAVRIIERLTAEGYDITRRVSEWINRCCSYGCDCGDCYSRCPNEGPCHCAASGGQTKQYGPRPRIATTPPMT